MHLVRQKQKDKVYNKQLGEHDIRDEKKDPTARIELTRLCLQDLALL
jgi:hypothetical protein